MANKTKRNNIITQEIIDNLIRNADYEAVTVFDKCMVLMVKLANGFVIVESSACVDPENYNKEVGLQICIEKVKNKLWELEGYRLQSELYDKRNELQKETEIGEENELY